MSEKSLALILADASDNSGFYRAPIDNERAMAAELRRLDAINADLLEALQACLETLKAFPLNIYDMSSEAFAAERARNAIAKATK